MMAKRFSKRARTAGIYVEDAKQGLLEAEGVEAASVWRCPCLANERCTPGDPRPTGACSVAAVYGRNRSGKLTVGFTMVREDPAQPNTAMFTAYVIESPDQVPESLAFAVERGSIRAWHFRALLPVLREAFHEGLS